MQVIHELQISLSISGILIMMDDVGDEKRQWKRSLILENMPRYFLHGILLFILSFVLAFVWIVVSGIMLFLGVILGLIGAFLILFYGIGFLNSGLMEHIWHRNVRDEWTYLILHGFLLTIALYILHISIEFATALLISITPFAVTLLLPVLFVFVVFDGVVAKGVANVFSEPAIAQSSYSGKSSRSTGAISSKSSGLDECPFCHLPYPYREEDVSDLGLAYCRHCGASLLDPWYVQKT